MRTATLPFFSFWSTVILASSPAAARILWNIFVENSFVHRVKVPHGYNHVLARFLSFNIPSEPRAHFADDFRKTACRRRDAPCPPCNNRNFR